MTEPWKPKKKLRKRKDRKRCKDGPVETVDTEQSDSDMIVSQARTI
jgi:hypothetical protein